jgi:hypothetical protein
MALSVDQTAKLSDRMINEYFTCGLFNDVVRSSDNITSHDRVINQ